MTNKRAIPSNEKESLDYIDDTADQLDAQRLSGLQEAQNTQLIKDEVLKREKLRLETKHGISHPEVQEAENRITYNKQMFTGLDNEIEKAKIKTEKLAVNDWRVQGRVFDTNSKPVNGITVFLADQQKQWIQPMGNSCTNAMGYYALNVNEKLVTESMANKQPLYLSASDKNKKLIYFATEPLFAAKGLIEHKDIYLHDETCETPPTRGTDKNKINPEKPGK